MAVGFFRSALGDPELRDALLLALRRGPFEGSDLARWVGEEVGRENLRPASIGPTLIKLADRGLVNVSKRGGIRLYSLTLDGHDVAEWLAAGESFDEVVTQRSSSAGARGDDEISAEARRQIERVIESVADRAGLAAS